MTVGDGFNDADRSHRRSHLHRVNPAFGFTVTPTDNLTFYADYNRGQPRAHRDRVGLLRPRGALRTAQRFRQRPRPQAGCVSDLRGRAHAATSTTRRSTGASTYSTPSTATTFSSSRPPPARAISTTSATPAARESTLAIGGKLADLTWHAVYSFVDATYQSNFLVNAESNSTADENGNIQVAPGDRIPLIPRHTGRLVLDYDFTKSWDVGRQRDRRPRAHSCTAMRTMPTRPAAPTAKARTSSAPGGSAATPWSICTAPTTSANPLDMFVRVANVFDKQLRHRRIPDQQFLQRERLIPRRSRRLDQRECGVARRPLRVWAGIRFHWD